MKMSLKIITALVIISTLLASTFYVVTNYSVAKSKISVEITASPKIQDELKDEIIDASETSIVEAITGKETGKVTAIIKVDDPDKIQNAVAKIDEINVVIINATPQELVNLSKDSNVKYMYADGKAKIYSDMATSLRYLRSSPTSSSAGSGSRVCILDTGIDASHPWFSGKVIHQANFLDTDVTENAFDDNGHGTHVAGIVTSVVPGAELYIGKVCNSEGWCLFSDIMRAMDWCVSNDVDVISMSLGTIRYPYECDDYMISQQINAITEKDDVLVTAAAGNVDCMFCQDYKVALPGCASKAISVSAIDVLSDNVVFNPANYDMFNSATICPKSQTCYKYDPGFELIDIVANGYVESAWPGGGTAELHGTSMATPHVAGAIALLKSINHANSETIRQYLYSGAIKEGYNANGLLNTARSCQQMLGESPISCSGYFASWQIGINKKPTSTDWLKLKLNGVEKRYKKSSSDTISINYKLNRSINPVLDYYNKQSEYEKSEVRKITNNIFVVTKKLGGKITYNIEIFEVDNSVGRYTGKRATITKFTEVSDFSWKTLNKRMTPEKNLKFYPLEKCEPLQQFECSKYVKEVEDYIPNMTDVQFNNLEVLKPIK